MKNIIKIFLVTSVISFNNISGQSEDYIISSLFSSSDDIVELTSELISISVEAVWGASELAGIEVITGTLTQSQSNTDIWTYNNSPTDKLIVKYAAGLILEFKFTSIDGFKDGTAKDFEDSHYMDFTTNSATGINLHIVSSTGPDGEVIKWQRQIKGNILYDNEVLQVDLVNNGQYHGVISGSIGIYKYWDEAIGTIASNTFSKNVSEAYWRTMSHNSSQRIFSMDTEIKNNGSISYNNNTYRFQNAHVFWVAYTQFADSAYIGVYNQVIDSHQWIAEGLLLKNNTVYGEVVFDEAPINYTDGPNLVCRLANGHEIVLHSLLNKVTTDIQLDDVINYEFKLEQNYPNPFNPSTIITYTVPSNTIADLSKVELSIYDILGKRIIKLVNKEQSPGKYEIKWDASNYPSGRYFYRLKIGSSIETKKMLIQK